MSLTPTEIRAAIATSPELQALAVERNDQEIARILSVGRKTHRSKTVNSKQLASIRGMEVAEEILLALEDIRGRLLQSPSRSVVVLGSALRRQLTFMSSEQGVDFGDPEFLALITRMVQMKVWTEAQGNLLRGISEIANPVSVDAVSEALNQRD